ncbi:MAG TPA: protein phosphatase 2C domain-containing protein [Anaerolineae bacterium]
MTETAKLTLPQPNTGFTSDPGRVREKNEDSFWVSPPTLDKALVAAKGWLFIVADGMGGYQGGEVASAIVVKAASDSYYAEPGTGNADDIMDALRQAVFDSQKAVLQHQSEDTEHSQMGSTLVMAVVRESDLFVANLGDSRCYRLRDGQLTQLSRDHSWVAEQVRSGLLSPDQVHGNVNRSLLTRALGQASSIVKPEIEQLDWRPGDRLLLCCDGLWDMVPDDNIRILLSKQDPQEASQALVDAANAAGGVDNITAVVVGSIEANDAMPIVAGEILNPVTSKIPIPQAAPVAATATTPARGLPKAAIIATAAIIVMLLMAVVIISQLNTSGQAAPSTTATMVAAAQRPSATHVKTATVDASTVPTTTVNVQPTLATSGAAAAQVTTTQSVSEAIAASTVVATETPTALPQSTTTPMPTLSASGCVTRSINYADWQKSDVSTGVQLVADGIAVWGGSHIATNQTITTYMGLDQLQAPFTLTVKTLSGVAPSTKDLWVCFQNDVNSVTCSNTVKIARVTQVKIPGSAWAFSFSIPAIPSLPQLRIISLAKSLAPITITGIEYCQG